MNHKALVKRGWRHSDDTTASSYRLYLVDKETIAPVPHCDCVFRHFRSGMAKGRGVISG